MMEPHHRSYSPPGLWPEDNDVDEYDKPEDVSGDFATNYQPKKRKAPRANAIELLGQLISVGHKVTTQDLSTMDTNDLVQLAKAHNLLTDNDDINKHAEVAILDLDNWVNIWREKTGIEDPTALFTDNKVGVKESELLDLGFKFINHGTVYGCKKENSVNTLVFSVQFFPLEHVKGSPNPLTLHDQDEMHTSHHGYTI
ncbi:hypothetical protein FRC07_005435 [Ceratobasidium sp. 392]|nr:hypothetical protein FRC07_005435 [Ceratobasidium sp. 392]